MTTRKPLGCFYCGEPLSPAELPTESHPVCETLYAEWTHQENPC